MTTRVSSGAIRHKSVSEILGEKPKPSPTPEAVKEAKEAKERATLSSRLRLKERRERENERSKLSTVVFPKQSPLKQKGGRRRQGAQQRRQPNRGKGVSGGELTLRQGPRPPAHPSEENDYLFTLFQAKAHLPPRSLHLNTLLASAHKILSTADHLVDYNEQMSCRTLKRLYQLQSGNRWPLRQIERSQEPSQGGLHWDVVLNHARWMATDFREERKWKIVAAKACAEWCREYVLADAEEKAELRVNAYIPPLPTPAEQQRQETEELPDAHTTPDLVSHGDASSSIAADDFFDEPGRMGDTVVPAAIFSLGSDEFTINLDRTAARDSILDELPLFAP
ncbi:chromatin modification- protein VID21, partial [Ascosphaera atra]